MKIFKLFFCVLFAVYLITGCQNEEACLSNQNAVQAELFSAWGNKRDTVLVETSLVGLGREDSVYSRQSLSTLFMPLKYESDTTSFVLAVQTLKDTISFVYRRELDFISGDCGYIFSFEIDTVLHTNAFVDSVSVEYPFVKYGESTENIKLFIY